MTRKIRHLLRDIFAPPTVDCAARLNGLQDCSRIRKYSGSRCARHLEFLRIRKALFALFGNGEDVLSKSPRAWYSAAATLHPHRRQSAVSQVRSAKETKYEGFR